MRGGPRGFAQDFSCPALLRRRLAHRPAVSDKGLSPASAGLSRPFSYRRLCARRRSYNPGRASLPDRFGLLRFRSPLLAESLLCFLLLRVLRCFSSPRSPGAMRHAASYGAAGFPIRKSAGRIVFADNRGFSQLITSFFASRSHRHPPCALRRFPFIFQIRSRPKAVPPTGSFALELLWTLIILSVLGSFQLYSRVYFYLSSLL